MTDTRVLKCVHCGKQAVFQVRSEGTQYGASLPKDLYNIDYDAITITTWRILECVLCSKPTIVQETVEYCFECGDYRAAEVQSAETIVLYPEPKIRTPLTDLPETMEKKYLAALKVQDIEPSACAVLAGRTLEAVCNHEKAVGRTLADKINNLLTSNRIPKTLAEMAGQLRQIRNLGAHDAEDEVTEEDVPIILDFLEAILEYLYVAPAKIAAVQARLKKTP